MSGRQGLVKRFASDVNSTTAKPQLRIIGEQGQMANGIYNPMKRYGYMSPSNATFGAVTFSGGTHTAIMGSSIYDAVNLDYYFAERGQYIWKGDGFADYELALEHDLSSTGTPVIRDLEIYQINGTRKLFYLYEKSGNMEIGEASLPISSENDDWLTADVSGAFTNVLTNDAFMRVADNGFMYVFQDNNVHKVDGTSTGGTTGTISANVLQFPTSWQIVDAIDYRGNVYIAVRGDKETQTGAENSDMINATVGIYVWDRFSSIVRTRDWFPLEGVKQIRKLYIAPDGSLRAITIDSQRLVQIRQFNGSSFNVIEEVGRGGYPGFLDGLTTFSQMTVWLGDNGIIYVHGKITDQDKESLYKIGDLPEAVSTTGAILFGSQSVASLVVGYTDNSSGMKVKVWDIYGAGGLYASPKMEQGDVYTLVNFLPTMSTVNYIDLFMATGATASATTKGTVKIYFNQSSAAWGSKTVSAQDCSVGYKTIDIGKPYVNSVQLEVEWPTADDIGDDFAPSFAVVDYTPTTTRG